MPAFDLLISDCDGVIVDSEILSKRVLFEALCAYAPAARLAPLLEDTFGLTVPTIVRLVEQTFDLSIPETFDEDVRRQSEAYVAEPSNPCPAPARRCWASTCRWPWRPTAAATTSSPRWPGPA